MTDSPENSTAPEGTKPRTQPGIAVHRQFIRDFSFENPGNNVAGQPNIDLGIDVTGDKVPGSENSYEITLQVKVRAGSKEATLFVLEMDYVGVFELTGFNQNDLEPILLIECPRILFPFARRIIADITAEGGFPPLRIEPVDFTALYLSQKKKADAGQGALN